MRPMGRHGLCRALSERWWGRTPYAVCMKTPERPDEFDVLVVGAGPSGSSAAKAAAEAGAKVALVDRATFPRYKTCGGGLIGQSLSSIPHEPPVREDIHRATFTLRGEHQIDHESELPVIKTVMRDEFDSWLMKQAVSAGAQFEPGCDIRQIDETPDYVDVRGEGRWYRTKWLIGADGTSSRVARYLGVDLRTIDLGLEVEVSTPRSLRETWAQKIHLDWGPIPGSYGWVFPKDDVLTVGVIASKGMGEETRAYLRAFLERNGLERAEVIRDSGHLTRCRSRTSPLARNRVAVVGDAAGLLEPWTREGISFAVRSGRAAGECFGSAKGLVESDPAALYARHIENSLVVEMEAGEVCLDAFRKRPSFFHWAVAGTPLGWNKFCRITRGDSTLARALRHAPVRLALRGIALGR